MAPQWFKSVTRDTWDDNNFYPHDYSRDPVRGLQLWRQAHNATLPTNVRYLCESLTEDTTIELKKLRVPTLIVIPGFDDQLFVDQGRDYMRAFCQDSWAGVEAMNDLITVVTIENARAFIMDDQPEKLNDAISRFLEGKGKRGRPAEEPLIPFLSLPQ